MTTMTKSKPTTDVDAELTTQESPKGAASSATDRDNSKGQSATSDRETKTMAKGAGRLRAVTSKIRPPKGEHFVPTVVWAGLIRSVSLLGFYLMVVVTVFGTIPFLGVWIHQQGAARNTSLSSDGVIAAWLVPFVFSVCMLAVGELLVMRGVWRAGSRLIARITSAREATSTQTRDQSTTSSKTTAASKPRSQSGTNRNKKKR